MKKLFLSLCLCLFMFFGKMGEMFPVQLLHYCKQIEPR